MYKIICINDAKEKRSILTDDARIASESIKAAYKEYTNVKVYYNDIPISVNELKQMIK